MATVRLSNKLFTVANIPTPNIENYVSDAQRSINTSLGVTTDLSDTDIAIVNVRKVATVLCAIDCCDYDSTLFQNNSEYLSQLDAYFAKYENELNILINWLGVAKGPTVFSPPKPI